jgi:NAD(P)-dependent dehydrogenase (short-subunit alcohol dehydrogenase family)
MVLDFNGKTAVVTGGANGIGFAVARKLAGSGAKVWLFDVASENPGEVAARFGGRGAVVDVTDRASIEAGFDEVGTVDVVIANAGTAMPSGFFDTSASNWERTIAVNLTGMFHTVQAAAARMKNQRGGSIVLTASTNSYDGEKDLTAYNASKAGVLGLLRTIANELGPYGIRVNAVCPGMIRTRLTEDFFRQEAMAKEYFRDVPLGRGGNPDEVANAVVFLASDAAAFITGATLLVDGGQMCAKFGTWSEDTADFKEGRWRVRG